MIEGCLIGSVFKMMEACSLFLTIGFGSDIATEY